MSVLAAALLESLPRLLGGGDAGLDESLRALLEALALALERGELGLNLEDPAPEGIADAAWPQAVLEALQQRGWLVEASALAALDAKQAALCEAVLVRDGPWLRWRRWHEQLQACLEQLLARAEASPGAGPQAHQLAQATQQAQTAGLDGSQTQAVLALLQHRLVLLSGGPGTGKTSTVVQMLAAALRQQPALRLHLAAPTGKAAGRLAQALNAGAEQLEPALQEPLRCAPCTTLHRLLEAQAHGFRRQRSNPLALDLLVVDEVSMVDLELMHALLEALPAEARLLLVGDAGQLPPVGTGSVLLELYRPSQLERLGTAAVELRTTYRNNGAIAAAAQALRSGEPLLPLLTQLTPEANLRWLQAPAGRLPAAVLEALRQQQEHLAQLEHALLWRDGLPEPAGAEALLQALEQWILLTPIRQGAWGVEGVHRALLGDAVQRPLAHWPRGTPVLNRRNLPEQGLANGDIGVLVQRGAEKLVLFAAGQLLHPARLGMVEPALALTVHKAQGSQYARVVLLLPPSRHRDPRLLYTGLTRAQQEVLLVTPSGNSAADLF